MKLVHRFAYYLGGFSIGLVILFFFLSGKKASCDYSPDARVLKNIRIKERVYSDEASESMRLYNIDSTQISAILNNGDVDFSRSNTDLDSCKTYIVTGRTSEKNLELLFENCDSLATLQKIWVK
ncbi:hypothetical protein GCM10007103_12630 [Salinimicrobium marinum]|uniref:DUF4258 domain-containing protein n=1 Tax=Salinimicrobium marinum TaxID=680283 RepID=A0A918SCE7_9FLAO|nr:DUF4258 domain-containing protein [Salinimicrobium marinum]GHA32460.1 hypothetical protein GCM10007103_12630 [Salinimicrobium marinum]